MTRYTIEVVKDPTEHMQFFIEVGAEVSKMYGDKFRWTNFNIDRYCDFHRITVCLRNGKPVGVMLARLFGSIFDRNVRILYQDLLYARPGTRAAKLLLEDFIDFGKANADHIISCIGEKSNVKSTSLERKGFLKLEELYRIEV